VQQDHVPHEVGIGLLPERFPALAPYRSNDGGDVERLRVRIERVVQRVITNVTSKRDLDIVLFASAPFKDALKLAAEVAFDFENDTGELSFRVVGAICEQLAHRRQNQPISFATPYRAEGCDAGIEAALRDGEPVRERAGVRDKLPMHFAEHERELPSRARIGISRKHPKLQFRIFPIEVNVGQREHEGEEQERCGVEKQIVTLHHYAEGRWLLVCDQVQQWIVYMGRIEGMENDSAGQAEADG